MTSGTLIHTVSATLIVTLADFSLSVRPTSVSVNGGVSAIYTVTITRDPTFTGAVNLSVVDLTFPPAGTLASFSSNPVTGTSSTLTITTNNRITTPPGKYPFTITGTSGALTHITMATLVVQ